MLYNDGQWYAASLQVRPEDLPPTLTSIVLDGDAARQVVWMRDRPVSVVGVPLAGDLGHYFEVFTLADVADTLATISYVLVIAGTTTTLAGAILGKIIAGRVLRPLRDITDVASQISLGELESRLDEAIDPDLAVLTASFNRMADALQNRIVREAKFASDVAHELRTPLTTVLTSLSVLENRREELSPKGREALALLGRDVRRLERTAAHLVETAKHDAGVITAELEPLSAPDFVSRLLNRLRRPDLPIVVDQSAVRAFIHVDEIIMERIIVNLIDNADTHGGGATRLTVQSIDGRVRIGVEDEGPGVSKDERKRVFDRFVRGSTSEESGSRSGTGLGLALAAENTDLLEGDIWVEDSPGGGARFVVELDDVSVT